MASVLDLIGDTPLIEVTRIDRGPCRLFLKLESANPSGSLKDRPARTMIEAAEADGRLKPGGPIVEATAGNTGLGLAVVGVGSGGTLTGIGRFMRRASPKTTMVLADPEGSVLAPYVESGRMVQAGSWAVEGIGEDFVPPNADLSLVSQAFAIPDAESFASARELLRAEGVLAGSSSGTLLAAALRYCRAQAAPQRVVSLVCDSGAKYLSKGFNPIFLAQEGWSHPDRHGTLRDVVVSRYSEGTAVVVRPEDNLRTVFARMRSTDVSQLPVVDAGGPVIGLVHESHALAPRLPEPDDPNRAFARPVAEVMATRLETISADAPIADLLPLFRKDYVAIVMDGDQFLGVATRLDLINYFRIAL